MKTAARKKTPVKRKTPTKISPGVVLRARQHRVPERRPVALPSLPPGVQAKDAASLANDACGSFVGMDYDAWAAGYCNEIDLTFQGYPRLAQLAQRVEYRSPAETIANEMTRKFITFHSTGGKGDKKKAERIEGIKQEMERLKIKEALRKVVEFDNYFGRCQLYLRIKGQDTEQLRSNPLIIDPKTIGKDSFLGVRVVEPLWTMPYNYDTTDPLSEYFYRPRSWMVFGKLVHASRLLTFVSREVPDMLKPAYNFGGLSMTQLMEPYVNQWLRTRNSVSDMLHSFSVSGIKTDLSSLMSGVEDDDTISNRAELFNLTRDNKGLFVIDKDTEEFFQFNVPLSGLDSLQAQSQEHMAAPSHIPLVKLLGVTPSGLGNTASGEIQVFYDFVLAEAERILREPLTIIINLIQLSLYGDIDPTIKFTFAPLEEMSQADKSRARKDDVDGDCALIDRGVVSPEEVRVKLAANPDSGYDHIDPEDVPEPPDDGGENDLNPKGKSKPNA